MTVKAWIQRDTLHSALHRVMGAIENKSSTLPTLTHVHISVEGKNLCCTGTNLEMQLQSYMQAPDCPNFAICCPARKLMDILKLLPTESMLELSMADHRLTLICGKSRFVLSLLPAERFPAFDRDYGPHVYGISCDNLKLALIKCASSMATGDVRFYLNGLRLKFSDSSLEAVASDGHRLALWTVSLMCETSHPREFIVPRRSVVELIRILPDDLPEHHGINVSVTDRMMVCRIPGGIVFSTKLVEGRYPDFTRVIPHAFDAELELDREAFADAVRRVAILSRDEVKGVSIDLADGAMRLRSRNQQDEEATDVLDVGYDGKVGVAFNSNYLLDALSNIASRTVLMRLNEQGGSVFKAHVDALGYHMIMPMKL